MNLISDEILNKYLDGELSADEIKSLDDKIRSDAELKKRFNALKKVHKELSLLNADEVPSVFTKKVMMRISKKYRVQKDQKYFIAFIYSIFGALCFAILGYLIVSVSGEISETITTQTSETVNNYSENFVQVVKNLFSKMNISVLGSILSIVLLVSGYFFFEMSKHSKANLSN